MVYSYSELEDVRSRRVDGVAPVQSLTFPMPRKSQCFSFSSTAGKKADVPI